MNTRKLFIMLCMLFAIVALFWGNTAQSADTKSDTQIAQDKTKDNGSIRAYAEEAKQRLKDKFDLPAKRKAAAKNFKERIAAAAGDITTAAVMDPGGTPHYYGPYPNYANSPLPRGPIAQVTVDWGGSGYTAPTVEIIDVYEVGSGATATATVVAGVITLITVTNTGADYIAPIVNITDATGIDAVASATVSPLPGTGIRKFMDSLPLLNAAGANNLGQYIPIAIPDKTTYPGCDYYEIELGEYTEQLHRDIPATRLRGYRQTNTTDATVSVFNYLGPLIIATRDVPVRVKFTNNLPTDAGGNLFIPVDETAMGAGEGPIVNQKFSQNRAGVHLHGGFTPWISDGTPHQWVTPASETTSYPRGVSVYNVPDMPDGGVAPATKGVLTFYYTNQQGARLMFYHDHALAITRLNVYVGEAAGYLLTDAVEQNLINDANGDGIGDGTITPYNPTGAKVLPDVGVPLIVQDRTFVDPVAIPYQDPTWRWGTGAIDPATGFRPPTAGDLWLPHVYMPNQNPWDPSGMSPVGRWHYGPWFWPPTTGIMYGPIANPYYDPNPFLADGITPNPNYEPAPQIPGVPHPSAPAEGFMDTPLVNGTAYPFWNVEPKTYRFRILSAANDRFFNFQLYVADPYGYAIDATGNPVAPPVAPALPGPGVFGTEVKMVPSVPTPGWPANWPKDARDGGVPDPIMKGPNFIVIGNEGGFLPAPVVVPTNPVGWNFANPASFDFGIVDRGGLILGPAERADVLVDFSAFAGKTLILYNDAPAPFPAIDPRYDYYTGHPDLMDMGGAPTTLPGYGPNTRTIMQIRVAAAPVAPAYNIATLNAVWSKTAVKPGVFETDQDMVIVPEPTYNSAYNKVFPGVYSGISNNSLTFTPAAGTSAITVPFEAKAIHDEMGATFDVDYGRMSSMIGLEMPFTGTMNQNFVVYPYFSPPVDIVKGTVFGTPIGATGDGTTIWKITQNGVDTHTLHFHLYNVQLLNRVAWDNTLRYPDPYELGWKETVRVNPLQDTIVAIRPTYPLSLPFKVPNSVRLIDPTKPVGALLEVPPPIFSWVDPASNPVFEGSSIPNHAVNFGWEYVLHCHLLAHEEMDMMHTQIFAVPPEAPTNLTGVAGNNRFTLTWNNNSLNQTGVTIQRAKDALFTTGLVTWNRPANTTSYVDNTFRTNQTPFYYRVFANNTVGDTMIYPAPSVGFPTQTLNSTYSNVVGPPAGSIVQNPLAQAAPARSPVLVSWTYTIPVGGDRPPVSGFTIQRARDAAFTQNLTTYSAGAAATSFSNGMGGADVGRTYWYRVAAKSSLGTGPWSNVQSIVVH